MTPKQVFGRLFDPRSRVKFTCVDGCRFHSTIWVGCSSKRFGQFCQGNLRFERRRVGATGSSRRFFHHRARQAALGPASCPKFPLIALFRCVGHFSRSNVEISGVTCQILDAVLQLIKASDHVGLGTQCFQPGIAEKRFPCGLHTACPSDPSISTIKCGREIVRPRWLPALPPVSDTSFLAIRNGRRSVT